MGLCYKFIRNVVDADPVSGADRLFDVLYRAFEHSILRTYQTRHVQCVLCPLPPPARPLLAPLLGPRCVARLLCISIFLYTCDRQIILSASRVSVVNCCHVRLLVHVSVHLRIEFPRLGICCSSCVRCRRSSHSTLSCSCSRPLHGRMLLCCTVRRPWHTWARTLRVDGTCFFGLFLHG